jgi:hypothetical protein
MEDNVTPKIKEPPVLYESTQSDVAKLARLFGGPVIAYWNNPRGAVCHNDVLALYSVLEKLGYHDTVYLFPAAARDRRRCASFRVVYERTGDRPFGRIEDVISAQELAALSQRYKRVAGYDHEILQRGHAR